MRNPRHGKGVKRRVAVLRASKRYLAPSARMSLFHRLQLRVERRHQRVLTNPKFLSPHPCTSGRDYRLSAPPGPSHTNETHTHLFRQPSTSIHSHTHRLSHTKTAPLRQLSPHSPSSPQAIRKSAHVHVVVHTYHTSPPVTPHKGVPRHLPKALVHHTRQARGGCAQEGAPALLAWRRPSLELEFDLRASGLTELRVGRLVEVVVAQTADRAKIEVSARADSRDRASGGVLELFEARVEDIVSQ